MHAQLDSKVVCSLGRVQSQAHMFCCGPISGYETKLCKMRLGVA